MLGGIYCKPSGQQQKTDDDVDDIDENMMLIGL